MSLNMIPVEELDELIGAVVRILCSKKEKIAICGQEYPIKIVKSTFMKINIAHGRYRSYLLVSALHGQLIKIASNSEQHINPMDIAIDGYLFEKTKKKTT